MLDPSAETITVGGVAIPLGDNRLLKAGFEKYLAQPPESGEAAETYRATVQEILATISPFRQGGPNLETGFKLLPTAAAYPGDANICMTLAESIYTALLAKQDVNGLRKLNETMIKNAPSSPRGTGKPATSATRSWATSIQRRRKTKTRQLRIQVPACNRCNTPTSSATSRKSRR